MSVGRVPGMSHVRVVASVARVSAARVAAVSVTTSAVPAVRQPANCHGTESNGASRQRDQVEIHGSKSMRRTARG